MLLQPAFGGVVPGVTANMPPQTLYTTITNVIDIYTCSIFAFFGVPTKIRQNKAFSATFDARIYNLSFKQRKCNREAVNR